MIRGLCTASRNICVGNSRKTLIESVRNASIKIAPKAKNKEETADIFKWVLLAMPITSFGLGCWQVHRLRWKLDLIDTLHAKANSEPVPLPHDFSNLEELEYKPVKVRGVFLHEREMLIGPRALIEPGQGYTGSLVSDPKKNQGCLVITPFKLSDTGEIILVNRGWVPQSLRSKEARAPSMISHEVEITGIVRMGEKRAPFMPKNTPSSGMWLFRDLESMSSYAGSSAVWLDVRGVPDPPAGWPLPNQTRVTLRNEHLSYVVTWYGLAAFTGFMWHRYFIRKLPLA